MKVKIEHVEKKQGMVFKKTHYGVALTVEFNDEEKAIIEERKLRDVAVLERGTPSDIDADKHAERGLGKKILTAAIKGRDANHFDLTISRLLRGTDTYHFLTPIEAKNYEGHLKNEALPDLKGYLEGNAESGGSDTFEL